MEENQQGEQQEMEQAIQPIVEMGSSTIRPAAVQSMSSPFVGQIEGHQLLPPTSKSTKYEHVMPLLAMVEESEEVDGLLVLLNTVGGDIEAGLGIAELIASMSKPTVSLVLGGRALHRRAAGCVGQALLYRPIRRHDYPSGAAEWAGDRRAPDLLLF